MFVKAIQHISQFTRPIQSLIRRYGNKEITPALSSLFFVNDQGVAVTCKHVANLITASNQKLQQYQDFKDQLKALPRDHTFDQGFEDLLKSFKYNENSVVQIKNNFVGCVYPLHQIQVHSHPEHDLAILHFKGYNKKLYRQHATFLKDPGEFLQGKTLCRAGFPFPEYKNFSFDDDKDEMFFNPGETPNIPIFPLEGMLTRNIASKKGEVFALEISTPGLKGQSGGPLFDTQGRVFGMQQSTKHLHLGFDIENKAIRTKHGRRNVNNYAFLHLGQCIRADVIKKFLEEKGYEYHEA
jgi:hypothetical protein